MLLALAINDPHIVSLILPDQ